MKAVTVVAQYRTDPFFEKAVHLIEATGLVDRVLAVRRESASQKLSAFCTPVDGEIHDRTTLMRIINETGTNHLLFLTGDGHVFFEPGSIEKMIAATESTKAGIVFSDFYDLNERGKTVHPLSGYQSGSVRDDFDFGGALFFSTEAIQKTLQKYGLIPDTRYAGLYDLRLKVSIECPVHHIPEPLYSMISGKTHSGDGQLFAYVDPRNADVQKEMEIVFTDYLKKIGAYLSPGSLRRAEQTQYRFPFTATVVIPVKNRVSTINGAVESALSQETDFPFNVIVVDNHSMDGTTEILSGLAKRYPTLKHIIPISTDLGIGGCWNEAINSKMCGRYAVQLDSDDLYSSTKTLQRMVDALRDGKYAMVIGSYTIVDSHLKKITPGLVDHREWTDENGHNNALRVNGLGAPRGFDTNIIRGIGFPNVSYGEDYAAALRVCREYRVGRIYDSLYLCRRWEGNTDAVLTIEEANRNNAFKDSIRTEEIHARQQISKGPNP